MFRIFKELTSKWTIPGWLVLLFYLLVHILDWADRLESIQGKAGRMMPLLRPAIEFLLSSKGQLMILVIGLLLLFIATWRKTETTDREKKENNGLKQPKEPQPVIVAIDELKTLRYEGERLVNRFQIDSVKPTLGEVENWRKRMRECARQKVLATENLVSAKDLLKLDKRWDEGEVLRITAKFFDHGCFADGSVEMAVFQSVWGHVQRLNQLIAKIEGEESTVETNNGLQQRAVGLSKISRRLDEEIEKGRVGLEHPDVPPPLDQTAIEAIDEVMEECQILERIFASLSDPLPDNQPRVLVEEARIILHRYAPEYVDKFNSVVKNPKRSANFPAVTNRTVEELGKWTSDKTRRDGWDIIDSILRYLALVRSNLYSKLP
jgi:hypothetical protein